MRTRVMILVVLVLSGCGDYSDGVRVGSLNKFSRKGLIWKTWEGEMALGGYRSTDSGTVANLWQFCVEDTAIVTELQKAQETGKPVKLTYHEEFISAPWRCGTRGSYFVTKVEQVGN